MTSFRNLAGLVTAATLTGLALAACGSNSAPTPSKPAAILHLSAAEQGQVCAGINAMVFTGTSRPFATEAGATGYQYQVTSASGRHGNQGPLR
jgi:hypothetical protein